MTTPKYDRIVPLVGLAALGLGVALLLEIRPESAVVARLWGDLPALSVAWAIVAALLVIVSTGSDLLARSHPQLQHRPLPIVRLGPIEFEIAPVFWVLPSLTIVAAFAFFRLFRSEDGLLALLLALVSSAGLLMAVLIGQHYSLDRRAEVRERWQMVLQGIGYLDAFALFSAIYAQRLRTLYSAPLVAMVGFLLAFVLLERGRRERHQLLAALVGLTLVEATWVLNYWTAPFLMGGTVLLAIFYSLVGMLQYYHNGRLERRIVWEFGTVGGLVILAMVGAMLFFIGTGG